MSYIEEHIMPGERVLYEGRIHWLVLVTPVIVCVVFLVGITLMPSDEMRSSCGLAFIVAAIVLIYKALRRSSVEISVTNRRVVHKRGILSRNVAEMAIGKVESVIVNQTLTGRMFGVGEIDIRGTGAGLDVIKSVSHPMQMRTAILNVMNHH